MSSILRRGYESTNTVCAEEEDNGPNSGWIIDGDIFDLQDSCLVNLVTYMK